MNIVLAIITVFAIAVTVYVFYIIYNNFRHIKGFYILFIIAIFTATVIFGKGIQFVLWFLPEEWKSKIGYGSGFVLTLLLIDFLNKLNKNK